MTQNKNSNHSGFGKSYRLLKRYEFLNLKKRKSKNIYLGTCKVICSPNSIEHARLGIVVSRKTGNAVQRNFFKRKSREWFRRTSIKNSRLDILVIGHTANKAIPRKELGLMMEEDFKKALSFIMHL